VNITVPVANAGADFTKTCTQNSTGLGIGAASVAGVTYSWSPATGLTSSTVSNPTANPTATTTYTLTSTNTASGCTATDQVLVTVNTTIPVADAGVDFTKTCTQNSTGLGIGAASVAGVTYSWSPSTGLSSATVSNPTANPTATTTYTLTATNTASGCTATDQVLVTVNTTVPVANAGVDFTKTCTQNSTGLGIGAASVAGVTYSWSPSTGLTSSTVSNPTANPTATTTYALTATNIASGCTATDQVLVTVNTTVPVANAGVDFTKTCTQNSTGLGIGAASVAGVTYSWTPATGLSSSTVSNPTANPSATTTYTLTATNTASGCTATDQVLVTVNTTIPGADAGLDFTKTCVQNPNGTAIGAASVAGVTYSWSPTTGLSSTTIANPTANPIATSTYTLTSTNTASGCTATDQVLVTVNITVPVANAGADFTKTCTQNSTGLGIGAASVAGVTYSWSPSTGLTSSTVSNPTANPSVTTTYTLTATNTASGCTATDQVLVTVNTTIPVADAGLDFTKTCVQNPNGTAIGAASVAGVTYSWSPSTGLSSSTVSNPTANPTATTTYTLTATNTASGCTATDQVLVTVNTTIPVADAGLDFTKTCVQNSNGTAIGASSVAGVTYSWTPATGLTSSTVSNPTANPSVTTTYTLTATNTASGCTATDQVLVTVNTTIPVADAGLDFTKTCVQNPSGTAIGAASEAGVTYSWTPATGLSSSTVSNPTANPTATTTYTLTATNTASGCTATDQVLVTVNTTIPGADAGLDFTKTCVQNPNGTAIGTASVAGVTYSWSPATGLTSSTVSNPTANPIATSTYTLTATNTASGCTATDQVLVTVITSVPLADAGIDQSICIGETIMLMASGNALFIWDNNVSNGVSFTPISTATYTLTSIDPISGCSSTDQVAVTVNALPAVNAGADQVVCAGTPVTLSGSGASTYSWDNGISNGAAFTPASTGTYSVSGTDANGCVNTDQVAVTVNALPAVNAGADQVVCAGTSVTLSGSGASTYSWDNGIGNGAAFTPASTGTYSVSGTDANGCVNTDQVAVTVNALPSVNAGADQVVCAGTSVTLSGSGASTYSWDNGISNGAAFTPASTGTYSVSGTDANGCVNTDQVAVTVNALPSVNAGVDQTVCAGTSVSLSGTGATTYSWNDGVNNGLAFAPTSTSVYSVTGTDANGCIGTDQVLVTVNALPSVNAGIDQTICAGTSVSLSGTGATTYSWNNGVSNGLAFAPTSTSVYSVTGTDANGCIGTDQVLVTVNALPSVNAGIDQTICAGATATLTASGAASYSWDNGISNGVSFTPVSTATYSVSGTDANGCINSYVVIVTVNDLPNVSAGADQSICKGVAVTLSGTGASTYSWDNNVVDGVAFNPNATATYAVSGTDANGCVNTDEVLVTVNEASASTLTESAMDSFTLNGQTYTQSGTYTQVISNAAGCDSTITLNLTLSFTGLSELEQHIRIFPNPATDELTIESTNPSKEEYFIFDSNGRIVLHGNLNGMQTTIDLRNISPGIYLFKSEQIIQRLSVIGR
jgi:hypothetical protein